MGSVAATTTAPTPTAALATIALKALTLRAFTATPSPPKASLPFGESDGERGIFTDTHFVCLYNFLLPMKTDDAS
jgi:hypothetical protein